ncbi:MAG: hypothetical protein AB7P99_21675, partial [Vicinamibacterales bacterium]
MAKKKAAPKKKTAAKKKTVAKPARTRTPLEQGRVIVEPAGGRVIDVGPVDLGTRRPVAQKHLGNFFDTDRAGQPVVRPDDLLALRVELRNLTVTPGSPPRVKKTGNAAAYLVLHFPPQAITEETFFETRPPGTKDPKRPDGSDDKPSPAGSDPLTGPPVRARVSGESRLSFIVPNGFEADYTLEGILGAVEQLELSVPANALPPGSGQRFVKFQDLFVTDVRKLAPAARAALASFAARNVRLAAIEGDMTTVAMRQAVGGHGVAAIKPE